MDKSEWIPGLFWRKNKQTLLIEWIFSWNLHEVVRALFSGRIQSINPGFVGVEVEGNRE